MYRHRVQLHSQVQCTVQDICKVYRVQFQPRCTVEVMYRVYRGYSSITVSTIQELYSSTLFKARKFVLCIYFDLSTYMSIFYLSTELSIYRTIYLTFQLSICTFILSIYLSSIHPYIYLSTFSTLTEYLVD